MSPITSSNAFVGSSINDENSINNLQIKDALLRGVNITLDPGAPPDNVNNGDCASNKLTMVD
ncbi:MAG: hypothetical protein ACK40X_02505, partial [Armatimonadota bacterium]